MSFPAARRVDHQKFCEAEGWSLTRDAVGRTGTHHVTYEIRLRDGRTLRTRISDPVIRDAYGPGLWSHILRDQLDVTEAEFWACVLDGNLPARGAPDAPPPEAVPLNLIRMLINQYAVPEAEVRAMTKREVINRLSAFWSGSGTASNTI